MMSKHPDGCICKNCEDAETIRKLREKLRQYDELERACQSWIRWRNTLSFDCTILQIGSGDGEKWRQELAQRCEPLRKFLDDWFAKTKGTQ